MSLRSRRASLEVPSGLLARLPPSARRAVLHTFGKFAPWEPGFDFTPPTLLPGEIVGPPDFVGIGAQKAGTTWWYSLLASHPAVTSRPDLHKERHFFTRFGIGVFCEADVAAYHGWFPRKEGTITGEWTPDYLSCPWVAPLLVRAAPEARLIVVLRDPIDRFTSGVAHQIANGAKPTAEIVSDAINRGLYHQHLSWWMRHFDHDRLLVLQYELCTKDPGGQLARTYRFLGLDDDFRPPDLRERRSATKKPFSAGPDLTDRLRDVYTQDVASLTAQCPELDRSLWSTFDGALRS
jgi:Sulfotransferase domain